MNLCYSVPSECDMRSLSQVLVHLCVQRYEANVRQQAQERARHTHGRHLPSVNESRHYYSKAPITKENLYDWCKPSLYLRASSNLRLSHVVLTQRKTQNRGSIPVRSAWILPQPRTALNDKRDIGSVFRIPYCSAISTQLIGICLGELIQTQARKLHTHKIN